MGTPRLFTFANTLGTCPSFAKYHNMRVEAYIPELPADKMATKIMALIIDAAKVIPYCLNTSVNGLISTSELAKCVDVYGIKRLMTNTDKTKNNRIRQNTCLMAFGTFL